MERMTIPTRLVLSGLLNGGEQYGLELAKRTGLRRSTVYAALDRLETEGLVTSRRAEDERNPGRPRHYWQLTGDGQPIAAEAARWLTEHLGMIGREVPASG